MKTFHKLVSRLWQRFTLGFPLVPFIGSTLAKPFYALLDDLLGLPGVAGAEHLERFPAHPVVRREEEFNLRELPLIKCGEQKFRRRFFIRAGRCASSFHFPFAVP